MYRQAARLVCVLHGHDGGVKAVSEVPEARVARLYHLLSALQEKQHKRSTGFQLNVIITTRCLFQYFPFSHSRNPVLVLFIFHQKMFFVVALHCATFDTEEKLHISFFSQLFLALLIF